VTDELRELFRTTLLASPGGSLLKELMQSFPAEYRAFETDMLETALAGALTEELALKKGFDFSRGLSVRLFEGWQDAPDADLLAFTELSLGVLRELSAVDPPTCASLASGRFDLASTAAIPRKMIDSINEVSLARVRMARKGRASPVKRQPPKPEELFSLGNRYAALGGDRRWLTGLATASFGDMTPAAQCRNGIAWTQAILEQSDEMAARIVAMR
jgi:hypothetical protein